MPRLDDAILGGNDEANDIRRLSSMGSTFVIEGDRGRRVGRSHDSPGTTRRLREQTIDGIAGVVNGIAARFTPSDVARGRRMRVRTR